MSRKSPYTARLTALMLATSLVLALSGPAAHAQFMGGEMGGRGEMGGSRGEMGGGGMRSGGGGAMMGLGVGLAIGLGAAAMEHQQQQPQQTSRGHAADNPPFSEPKPVSSGDDNRFSAAKPPKRQARRLDDGAGQNKNLAGKKPDDNGKDGNKDQKQAKADDTPQTPAGGGDTPKGDTPKTPDKIADGGKTTDNGTPDNKTSGTPDKPATQAGDPSPDTGKRHLSIIHEDKPGTEQATLTIDGSDHAGKITVRTGVDVHWNSIAENGKEKTQTNMIAIKYDGTDCDDCMWVQFVWSEVLVNNAATITLKSTKIPTSSGQVLDTTTDPAKPNWIVDSAQPFGLAYSGTSNVGANTDEIFDKTGWPFDTWRDPETGEYYGFDQDKGQDISLEWRDHFESFLICKGKVRGKVTWNTKWTRSWGHPDADDDVNGPNYWGIEISSDGSLSDGQRKAIANKMFNDTQKSGAAMAQIVPASEQPNTPPK